MNLIIHFKTSTTSFGRTLSMRIVKSKKEPPTLYCNLIQLIVLVDSGGLQGKVSPHFPVAPCLENSASVPCLECKYITTLCMLVPFFFSIALVPQTSRLRHCLIVPYLPVMLQDKRKTIQTTEALFTRDLPSAITNKIPTSCLFFKTGIS